jgi:hypothetical protein
MDSENEIHDTPMTTPVTAIPVPAVGLFNWWRAMGTPATTGTTLADWAVTPFRDAWCFERRDGDGSEAFLLHQVGLVHFGWDLDTLETAYEILTKRRSLTVTTAQIQRRRRRSS